MLWTSLLTMPLGFTEPLFVPEYWLPHSVFNLAADTSFDLESFIFSFALGGIAVVLYELIIDVNHKHIPQKQISLRRLLIHRLLLFLPLLVLVGILIFTQMNPIYATIISLALGGVTTPLCRPDLLKKTLLGGVLFLAFYFVFFLLIVNLVPHFVEETWNLAALSGFFILGIPLEELLFAFAVGLMWSAIYEHVRWIKIRRK